jgi:release factor glutamine methyltransferase
MNILDAVNWGINRLSSSDTARLDAELLLLKAVNESTGKAHNRTWLRTWPEASLTAEQLTQFKHYIEKRLNGEPVAYIIGKKDFWTLSLTVTPATLIPRPETELLVETALEKIKAAESSKAAQRILDLGTGSGAIALALAAECPNCQILATDISQEALAVAQNNAQQHQLNNVSFIHSSWFEQLPEQIPQQFTEGFTEKRFDLIVSNPPYIAIDDKELEDNVQKHEPLSALHSGTTGLDDITLIIANARQYLAAHGWLILEHGYTQAEAIQQLLRRNGYRAIKTFSDLNGLARVTQAQPA